MAKKLRIAVIGAGRWSASAHLPGIEAHIFGSEGAIKVRLVEEFGVINFCEEILAGGDLNQGNFAQSARVQEVINAVALSHRERRWVDLPLPADAGAQGAPSPF